MRKHSAHFIPVTDTAASPECNKLIEWEVDKPDHDVFAQPGTAADVGQPRVGLAEAHGPASSVRVLCNFSHVAL